MPDTNLSHDHQPIRIENSAQNLGSREKPTLSWVNDNLLNNTSENRMVNTLDTKKIVSQDEWLEARKHLLTQEKEFTRLRDRLSQQRRELP